MPMKVEPQKSEVHESTDDASTSPVAGAQTRATPRQDGAAQGASGSRSAPVRVPEPADAHIVSDETDNGGPLVIESDNPELNPPHVPVDPFPTDRTPEIDPPVK